MAEGLQDLGHENVMSGDRLRCKRDALLKRLRSIETIPFEIAEREARLELNLVLG